MDWIDLAQEWDRWCALVNTVKNFRVPLSGAILLTDEMLVSP